MSTLKTVLFQAELVPLRSQIVERLFPLLPPLIVALVVFVSWYVSSTVGHVRDLFLPTPVAVLHSLTSNISAGVYWHNTLVTVRESVFGFLLALVVSLPLGYSLAKSRWLAVAIHPYLAAGQAIPAIVIAPMLVLWLGYGLVPNTVVCLLVVFFPIVINTILGVRTIDREIVDAARVEGASGWSMLVHIEFPLALPAILAAIRSGFTLSITGALVAEFVQGGDQGLGSLVMQALHHYDTPFMFATLLVLACLAVLYNASAWLLARLTTKIY